MYGNYPPMPPPPQQRSGMGPLVIILIVVGAFFVLLAATCSALFFIVRARAPASIAVAVEAGAVAFTEGPEAGSTTTPVSGESTVIERPGYSLKYPSNWSVDKADKDYDPDAYFAIDATEGCTVMFFFFEMKGDPTAHVRAQVDAQKKKVMPSPTQTAFTRWGSYDGVGSELKGRTKPVGEATIRIFSHAGPHRTFDVVEFCFDDDLPEQKPGFDLIEESFKLKKQ